MQKLLITSLCIFLGTVGISQINSGAILLGGDVGYLTVTYDEPDGMKNERKFYQFSPSIAMVVTNNLAFGVDLTYAKNEYENTPMARMEKMKDVGGGIFIRKYNPVSANFFLFGQGRLGYIQMDSEMGALTNPDSRTKMEGSKLNLSLMPGISYKAGKNLFLELALNNLLKMEFEKTETTYSSFGSPRPIKKTSFLISSSAGSVPLNLGMRFIFN